MAKQVATIKPQDLIVIEDVNKVLMRVPEGGEVEVYDADEDAGLGMENVKLYEQRIPILRILDPKSPQCKPVTQGGVVGARGGSIFNTSTGQIYDGERGLYVVVCFRDEKYVNYRKREDDGSGGGFVGIHDPDDAIVLKRTEECIAEYGDTFRKLPNGTDDDGNELELVQTFYHYAICVVPDADGNIPPLAEAELFRAMVPFSSTQIKKHTSWVERNKNIKVPMRQADGSVKPDNPAIFAHMWHLTTTFESRGSFSWYGWKLQLAIRDENGVEAPTKASRLDPKGALYGYGRDLFKLVQGGEAKPEYEKDTGEADKPVAGQQTHGNDGNNIPFDV